MTLFDEIDRPETEKRDRGIGIAADTNVSVLDWLRDAVLRRHRELIHFGIRDYVTADDGRELFEFGVTNGHFERPASMNFMGALFAAKGWKFTGERIKSKTAGSHANELKCWKWVGGN